MNGIEKAMLGVGAMTGALLLGGCMETMPRPERPSGPRVCTMEYAPVCAAKGRRYKTFGNSCTARADGYRVSDRPCGRGGRE